MEQEKATIEFRSEDDKVVRLICLKKEKGFEYSIEVGDGGDLDGFYADLAAAFVKVLEGGKNG